MEKRLIAALAAALVASLLVIAFLVGRMTGVRGAPALQSPAIVQRETPPRDSPTPRVSPSLQVPGDQLPTEPIRETQPTSPREPALIREQTPIPHAPVDTAISSYFAKIDAIHVVGEGDPMTFAQGILSGIESGDTSGIDSLVDSAKTALEQATLVQPPPSCADYHRRLLGVLSEAASGVTRMREAIQKSDLNAITALAPQMQATQQKIDELDRMKKQLLGQ